MKKIKLNLLIISLLLIVTLMTGCDITTSGTKDPTNYVYTTPYTDDLKLTATWEGKDFINDGIGEVTVVQNVDGDTTIVRVEGHTGTFTIRFLGIDTPESTYKVEPWGFAASDFTKGKLKDAETIVLQADTSADAKRKDSNGRFLAWVWYRKTSTSEFRLLNLEIVENAYSTSKGSGTMYAEQFLRADYDVRDAGCRCWGQVDPSYDDTEIGELFTIKELREKYTTLNVAEQNSYKGKVVRLSGIVSRQSGVGSAYLQQYDEETKTYYGMYVYGGFTSSDLKFGREVVVSGKIGYYNGALQITDLDKSNISVVTLNNPVAINEISVDEFLKGDVSLQGQLVTIKNLTVNDGYNTTQDGIANGSYSLYVTDANGKKLTIRIDKNSSIIIEGENIITGQEAAIRSWDYFKGRTITSITAVVGWYSQLNSDESSYKNDGLQLILLTGDDIKLAPAANN